MVLQEKSNRISSPFPLTPLPTLSVFRILLPSNTAKGERIRVKGAYLDCGSITKWKVKLYLCIPELMYTIHMAIFLYPAFFDSHVKYFTFMPI